MQFDHQVAKTTGELLIILQLGYRLMSQQRDNPEPEDIQLVLD
jgi:hypothetical protein